MKLKQEIEKNPNLDIAHQNYMKIKSGKLQSRSVF